MHPNVADVASTATLALSLAAVPSELRALPQWVAYRLERVEGRHKLAKVPYRAEGRRASTTDPTDWLSFAEAVELAESSGFHGVGFVFSEGDPYVGVDLDGAVDPTTGETATWAQAIVSELASYTEESPSGNGLHVIVRGTLPAALKTVNVEAYDRARYFTMTGRGSGEIREAQASLEALVERYRPERPAATKQLPPALLTELTDEEVVGRIAASKDAAAFHRLHVAGETRPNRSGSDSDFELACILARHLGGDAERIRKLMQASALNRGKWDREDYLPRTIKGAIAKAAPPATAETKGFTSLSIAELLADPTMLAVPMAVSPWLVWRGEYVLLAGREKLGKTTLAAADAVAAAKAGSTVLWIGAEEGANRIASRFHGLSSGDAGALGRIFVPSRWPTSWDDLDALIGRHQPDAIYVDSLHSLLSALGEEIPLPSETARWHALGLLFKKRVDGTKAGIAVLHHATKATGKYTGSAGIGAAPDVIIELQEVTGDPMARLLDTRGRWSFPSKTVRYRGDGFEELEKGGARVSARDPLSPAQQDAFQAFVEAGGGMRFGEWVEVAAKRFEASETLVKNARRAAEKAGLIERNGTAWRLTEGGRSYALGYGWGNLAEGLV